MDIIGKRNFYFILSLFVIIPGIISLIRYGLRFSIDFTGGSLLEIQFEHANKSVSLDQLKSLAEEENVEVATVQSSGENTYLFRTKPIDRIKNQKVREKLAKTFEGDVKEIRFETVGPIIGKELTQKAIMAVIVASFAILIYIAWAFRGVPKPASSWQFGLATILALIHDILVVVGLFSLLGHFYRVEVDSLFITALLTVMGFSVHDTIVVFDRIRENLHREGKKPFAEIVNDSMVQTLARSLSTSLTVLFTLFALLLFSSGSLRWFLVALLIGIISGTYSSIFNASPLLVLWQQRIKSKA